MSIFVFARNTPSESLDQLISAHEANGFALESKISVGDGALVLFDRLNRGSVQKWSDEQGQIIALGPFYYKGADITAGLHQFLADWRQEAVDWSQCHGHFIVLILSGTAITLLRTPLAEIPVYWDRSKTVLSNSLLGTARLTPNLALAVPSVQRYILHGSTYNETTFFEQISIVPRGHSVHVSPTGEVAAQKLSYGYEQEQLPSGLPLKELASLLLVPHQRSLRWITQRAGSAATITFSSGFDSRLSLALTLAAGGRPRLETYTGAEPWEADFARAIAKTENLEIHVLDPADRHRGATIVSPLEEPSIFERDFFASDGHEASGIFNDGVLYYDRLGRSRHGVLLHGGAGEIFRNYYYLPNRRYRPIDMTYFNYAVAPPWAQDQVDQATIETDMAQTIKTALGLTTDAPMDRMFVERLYLYHRGRYFFGADIAANQRFGEMSFIYIDAAKAWLAHQAPLAFKNYGVLQAEMIRQVCPRVAAYPSSYGFDFLSGPSLAYKLKTVESYWRPIWVRKMLAQRRSHKISSDHAYFHQVQRYAKLMDATSPYLRTQFALEKMTDPLQINRAASVELLCQRLNLAR